MPALPAESRHPAGRLSVATPSLFATISLIFVTLAQLEILWSRDFVISSTSRMTSAALFVSKNEGDMTITPMCAFDSL